MRLAESSELKEAINTELTADLTLPNTVNYFR